MDLLANLDILSVGLAVASTVVLGFSVYFHDSKNITNRTFFWFTLITAIWGVLNLLSYRISNIDLAFWLLRLELALGAWQAFLLFKLFYVFPAREFAFSKMYKVFLLPLVTLVSILCLTPFVFVGVSSLTSEGFINTVEAAPGIALFGIVSITLVFLGLYSLLMKIKYSKTGDIRHIKLFLYGSVLMFLPLIILNFVLPAVSNNSKFVPFGAVTIFPFVLFTSYAILKHKLFNLKVAGTGVLVFLLSIVTFGEIIFADELFLMVYRTSIFLLVLLFGILHIKGVFREVSLREQLQVANKGQENLIHIINHQIKGYLTKARNIFATLSEDEDYKVPEEAKPMLDEGLKEMTGGVKFVTDFLHSSNLEKGEYKYDMVQSDFKNLVVDAVENLKKPAEEKGLKLELEVAEGDYQMTGDMSQLEQVVYNLVDNSILYTPEGSVNVSLERKGKVILFTVKDTGVGISEELKLRLFTKGGRGKDSPKINVNSTGFGLAFVKEVVEVHKGRVWVESEGKGKGSTFYLELPIA